MQYTASHIFPANGGYNPSIEEHISQTRGFDMVNVAHALLRHGHELCGNMPLPDVLTYFLMNQQLLNPQLNFQNTSEADILYSCPCEKNYFLPPWSACSLYHIHGSWAVK